MPLHSGIINSSRPIVRPETNVVKRLACFDGLRGVLALYVLLSHMAPFAVLPPRIAWLLSHGEAGVDLFFVLSGMVIVRSLERFNYRARPFLIARAARIIPVFLPVFAFAVAVQPLASDFAHMPWIALDSPARTIWSEGWPASWPIDLATHLTMVHGLLPNGWLPHVWVSFLGSAWSLSTEWQFYALVAVIGARFGHGERGQWRLVMLLLGVALAAVAWREAVPPGWHFSRAFLPNKAMYFALGVASAALLENARFWPRFLAVLCAVMTLCLMHNNSLKALAPLVWVLCLAAQFAQGQSGRPWFGLRALGKLLSSAPLCWLGAMSYGMYLVNEPIQKLLGIVLTKAVDGQAMLFTLLWIPAAVLLPIAAAWWLHYQIETPALRRGKALAAAA
jgi:peptidoglycan/LPS O-acetylase OafA/YrhL